MSTEFDNTSINNIMSIITINDTKLQANIVGNNLIAFNWIDRVLVASQWLFIIYSFGCGTVNLLMGTNS